jgi:hypothetical protein
MSEKTYTQAEFDAAIVSAKADSHKAGVAEGTVAGATAERARFKTVMTADTYKGREASANHVLFSTDMSAEAIGGVLAGLTIAPVAAAPAAELPKDRAQNASGGLVVEGAQQDGGSNPAPANDFEAGKRIAASLPKSMRAV